jgi:hypothetical protein
MCTLSIIPLTRRGTTIGFRVVMNRDEERGRVPALPPARQPPGPESLARATWPTDPAGGGTWIAAADSGLVLCLLNGNPDTPRPRPNGARSRGTIIPSLIDSLETPHALAQQLARSDLTAFPPFRLVAARMVSTGTLEIADVRWDGASAAVGTFTPPACFASSGLGDTKVQCRLPLFDEVVAHSKPADARTAQDRFHHHTWADRPELSVMMSRADARTVSVTTVEVIADAPGPNTINMWYQPVPN